MCIVAATAPICIAIFGLAGLRFRRSVPYLNVVIPMFGTWDADRVIDATGGG
jgi:hypothetical protein